MTFGKRTAAPSPEAQAEANACPHCRGAGTVRARGQRKVCVPCKGTGKKPEVPADVAPDPPEPDTPA
jgi:DnaJ-class molecular chaperone